MRVLILCLFLVVSYANAFFAYGNLGDSRLQSNHHVYRPAGIVNYTLGIGFHDEPENIVDYKMSFGVTRLGYSYNDGDESVSLYMLDFNLLSWSVSYEKFYFEIFAGFSFRIAGTNFSDYMCENDGFVERYSPKYGYRLGYYIKDNLLVAMTANYNYVLWRYESRIYNSNNMLLVGGIGISVQYNIF